MAQVPEPIAAIYRLLEQNADPLTLCLSIQPHLAALEAQAALPLSPAAPVRSVNHAQHVTHLRNVAVLKMMRHLGSVYSVMRMERLAALVPFMSFSEVEAVLADAIKFGYVQVRRGGPKLGWTSGLKTLLPGWTGAKAHPAARCVRRRHAASLIVRSPAQVQIDHRSATLHFGGAQLKSDQMGLHLSTVATRLSAALAMIDPSAAERAAAARAHVAAACARESAEEENKIALARKVLIERRREENERSAQEAEREVWAGG